MDGLLKDLAYRSQLELLLSQQRYEDTMALLNDALNQNPQDRDACLFRLLVTRILVLRARRDCSPDIFPVLPGNNLLYKPVSSVRVYWRAVRGASVGCARRVLGAYAHYRLERPVLIRLDRLGQKLWRRVLDSSVIAHQRIFATSEILAVNVRNRLRRAAGRRSARLVSVVGLILIVAALCGVLLTEYASRLPAMAQARAVKSQTAIRPMFASVEPTIGLGAWPQNEKPSLASSIVDPPSRVLEDTIEDARDRQVSEKSADETEISKVVQQSPAVTKVRKQDRESSSTKQVGNADSAGGKRLVVVKAEQPSVARSNEKISPVSGALTKNSTGYRTRQSIAIRAAARFGAPTLDQLAAGTSVVVVDVKNSWAKVLVNGDSTGFVRIEFLEPAP